MGAAARRALLTRLSREERFDRGLELSDRMVEAVVAGLGEDEEEMSREVRRRRFEAIRKAH